VTSLVERQRRLRHVLVGCGCARRQEAGAQPAEQVVAGRIVGGNDDDPAAATGMDPVLRERDGLGGACARRVHLRVRAAGTHQFGELRVPHGEHTEQEPAIERVGVEIQFALHVVDAPVDLRQRGAGSIGLGDTSSHRLQLVELEAAGLVLLVPAHLVGQLLQAGEGGGEDDTGLVAQRIGQAPTLGELGADVRGLVALHERHARVAQGVEPGADGQLRGAAQCADAIRFHTELGCQVERPGAAGQLDHVGDVVDGFEAGTARVALDEAHDVLVDDLVAQSCRDHIDELLTVQHLREVLVVEHVRRARGAQRGAGDDHRVGAIGGTTSGAGTAQE